MYIALIIVAVLVIGIVLYLRQPKFGKKPSGNRLALMQQSPHYKNGKFGNVHFTPQLTEGASMPKLLFEFIFKKKPGRKPVGEIPAVKTDLKALPANENVLVWFGHSSYFMQVDGRTFLIDPVFSGNASPIPGSNTAFKGADVYTPDDFPGIDYLLITHDHYDHVDYDTIIKLKPKISKVITGLGVGEHFERWGFAPGNIIERDWNETIDAEPGFTLHIATARHFSGRLFSRNNTLWLSFILKTPTMNLYLGGDSGYDTHFAEIGDKYGPFDLAVLDNGQYDLKWKYIHMQPEEVVQAAKDLKAKRLFAAHSGKFAMANHPWKEPLERVSVASRSANMLLITPMIGEVVYLKNTSQSFSPWWVEVE